MNWNPVIHSQLRLAVITILAQVEEADFNYLKDKTEATAGNLSVQLDKLSEAGYIAITKTFEGKRPRTTASITDDGRAALEAYIETSKTSSDCNPGVLQKEIQTEMKFWSVSPFVLCLYLLLFSVCARFREKHIE